MPATINDRDKPRRGRRRNPDEPAPILRRYNFKLYPPRKKGDDGSPSVAHKMHECRFMVGELWNDWVDRVNAEYEKTGKYRRLGDLRSKVRHQDPKWEALSANIPIALERNLHNAF